MQNGDHARNVTNEVEERLQALVAPLKEERQALGDELAVLFAREEELRAAVKRIDATLKAISPEPKSKASRAKQPVRKGVSDDLVQDVFAFLKNRHLPTTSQEVSEAVGMSTTTARSALEHLRQGGVVRAVGSRPGTHGRAPIEYAVIE